jgi:WD40 repeat protein
MSAEGNLPPARPRGKRGGAVVAALIAAFVVAVVGFAGGFFLGSRRAVTGVESPARDAVAFVLEGRCAADRCQSLWIGPDTKRAKVVQTLSGSGEQAGEIAWTPDGTRVAFVINGYQLRVFDARSGAALGALAIIDPDGFPSSRIARGVTFSSNGAAITFDDCPRYHSGCKPGVLAIKK